MRAAFFEYVRLLSRHWWQLLIGGVAGIVGIAHDMGATWLEQVPTWIWYGIAILTFVVAQFWSFATLHKEVDRYRARPTPNTSLLRVHDYVWKKMKGNANLADPMTASMNAVLERALMGDIQIFGTRTKPDDGDGVMEPIEKEYWKEHTFSFSPISTFKLSLNDQTKRVRSVGEGEIYYNLHTDAKQALLCWPVEKRLRLQWPIRRENS